MVFVMCLAVGLVTFVPTPGPAETPTQHVLLTACNDTTSQIWVAVGAVTASQGWWKIQGGNCTYLGSFFTAGAGFNVYAQEADGTNWSGSGGEDDWYCVDLNNTFSLSDGWRENSADVPCPDGDFLKHFRFVHAPNGYGPDQDFSYTYRFHM